MRSTLQATGALDSDTEAELYGRLAEALSPTAAYVSVGAHATLLSRAALGGLGQVGRGEGRGGEGGGAGRALSPSRPTE